MAGHSKWANIQHRKGRQDEKRGRLWTKLIREVTVVARMGGGDLALNPRLRLALDKAAAANMPKDNIQRAIDRGTGNLEGVNYEEVRYEGYGVGGVAVIVDCMTDNKIRTVAEVRHAFAKHGGNLGQDGSVAFMFKLCGQILFAPGADENKVMEISLENNALDVLTDEEGGIEVLTLPADFAQIQQDFVAAKLVPELAEITMRPDSDVELSGCEAEKMQKLLDALEGLDDVQAVFSNASLDE